MSESCDIHMGKQTRQHERKMDRYLVLNAKWAVVVTSGRHRQREGHWQYRHPHNTDSVKDTGGTDIPTTQHRQREGHWRYRHPHNTHSVKGTGGTDTPTTHTA